MTRATAIELEQVITNNNEVEIPERLIQDYKDLYEKVEQTITKINNKRKKLSIKK